MICFNGQISNLVPRVLPSIFITEKWKEHDTFFTYVMLGSKDGKKDGRKGLTVHDRT